MCYLIIRKDVSKKIIERIEFLGQKIKNKEVNYNSIQNEKKELILTLLFYVLWGGLIIVY